MCNENCNCTETTQATPVQTSGLTDTQKYIASLLDDVKTLQIKLDTVNSDLDEKILIISALEGLILSEGSQDLQVKMTLKLAEIFKKDIK